MFECARIYLRSRLVLCAQRPSRPAVCAKDKSAPEIDPSAFEHITFPRTVTDHRIGLTLHKLDQVIEGDLNELIEALSMADQAEKMKHFAA